MNNIKYLKISILKNHDIKIMPLKMNIIDT